MEQYQERKEELQMRQEGKAFTTSEALVSEESEQTPNWLQKLFHPSIYKVAAVTFANGGDNIGIYIPFFATYKGWQIGIIIMIFLSLVAALCYIAYKLIALPLIAQILERYGHIIVPFVLIGLGILIPKENGTISYFIEKLS